MIGREERSGFTLIELLVVIAIIAILAAILFPLFARAKEAGQKAACQSNLKQIGMAMSSYLEDSNNVYPGSVRPGNGIESRPMVRDMGLNFVTWDIALYSYLKNLNVFHCPTDQRQASIAKPIVINRVTSLPRSYGYNDQGAFWNNTKPGKYPLYIPASLNRYPSRFICMVDWYYVTYMKDGKLTTEYNWMGLLSCCCMYGYSARGEHLNREGMNFLFYDGHVAYGQYGKYDMSEHWWYLGDPRTSN